MLSAWKRTLDSRTLLPALLRVGGQHLNAACSHLQRFGLLFEALAGTPGCPQNERKGCIYRPRAQCLSWEVSASPSVLCAVWALDSTAEATRCFIAPISHLPPSLSCPDTYPRHAASLPTVLGASKSRV